MSDRGQYGSKLFSIDWLNEVIVKARRHCLPAVLLLAVASHRDEQRVGGFRLST